MEVLRLSKSQLFPDQNFHRFYCSGGGGRIKATSFNNKCLSLLFPEGNWREATAVAAAGSTEGSRVKTGSVGSRLCSSLSELSEFRTSMRDIQYQRP